PARRRSSSSRDSALNAPRNLNAPIRWKFSHLKNSWAPTSASTRREVSTGVRWAWPRIRSAAACTSAKVGGVGIVLLSCRPHRSSAGRAQRTAAGSVAGRTRRPPGAQAGLAAYGPAAVDPRDDRDADGGDDDLHDEFDPVDAPGVGHPEQAGDPGADERGHDADQDGQPDRDVLLPRRHETAEETDDGPDDDRGDDARDGHRSPCFPHGPAPDVPLRTVFPISAVLMQELQTDDAADDGRQAQHAEHGDRLTQHGHAVEGGADGTDPHPHRVPRAHRDLPQRVRQPDHAQHQRDHEDDRRNEPAEALRAAQRRRPHRLQDTGDHQHEPRHDTPPGASSCRRVRRRSSGVPRLGDPHAGYPPLARLPWRAAPTEGRAMADEHAFEVGDVISLTPPGSDEEQRFVVVRVRADGGVETAALLEDPENPDAPTPWE